MFATLTQILEPLIYWPLECLEAIFVKIGSVSCSRYLSEIKDCKSSVYNPFSVFATNIATGWTFFMAEKPKYDYRLCEIRDRGGDLAKRWYVEFWVWDIAIGKLVRKVDYISAKFKTVPEKYAEARRIKIELDKTLINGAYIDSSGKSKKQQDSKPRTILKAVEWFRLEHSSEVGERAVHAYQSFENIFFEFLRKFSLDKIPVEKYDHEQILRFLSFLMNDRAISNRTRNNYLIWLNTVFNYLVSRKVIESNPAKEIKKLKTSSSTHVPYTENQALKIKSYLAGKDPQLLLFCAFIYYTLARPKEIQLLRIRDIRSNKLLIKATVKVNGVEKQLSKNHKSQYVVLPDGLRKLIEEHGIMEHNPDYFIFGKDGKPGPNPMFRHYSTKKYKPVLDALGINGGQTLYSWKHTGAIKLYQATKDMKKVQRQCRHWSITETDNYLRDLGMFEDDEVEFNFPDF